MSSHWKAVIGIFVIYAFGCFSGAICTSIFVHHKILDFLKHPAVAMSAALEKRLTGNLQLNADQQRQVDACFQENLAQRREVQKQVQPQVQALNRKTFDQILAILHPDQTDRFRENVEAFRKRWAKDAGLPDASAPEPPVGSSATNSAADSH
jgi:hypothetical protein